MRKDLPLLKVFFSPCLQSWEVLVRLGDVQAVTRGTDQPSGHQEMMSHPWCCGQTHSSTCFHHAGPPLLMHKILNLQTEEKHNLHTPNSVLPFLLCLFLLGLIKTTVLIQQMEDFETKPIHFLVMRQSLLCPLRGTGSMSCLLQAAPPRRLSWWAVWDRLLGGAGSRSEAWGAPQAQRGDAVPPTPRSLPSQTWRKGPTLRSGQGCRHFFLTEHPNHFHLSSGLSWHVPPACHDFQLLHHEGTSEKLLVWYPPASFSFPVIAVDCWQSFWHVHLISLWQEDGSMGELWINSKSSKLETGIALLSTILVSWLPLQPEESKRVIMSYVSSAPLLVWI